MDELCSPLGINGASVGSGDIAAGVSAVMKRTVFDMSSADLSAPLNYLELTQTLHLKGNLHVTHHHQMPRSLVLQSLPQLGRAVQQDPQNFALEVPAPLVEKSELPISQRTPCFVPLSTPDEDELRNNVLAGLHPRPTPQLCI